MVIATPAKTKHRVVRILELPDDETPGLLRIDDGRTPAVYWFRCLDAADQVYELRKFRTPTTYAVRIGRPEDCSCDCPHATWRPNAKLCRHIAGLLALRRAGKL